ncbi:MAG: hypothetical protein ACR2NQ_02455 [Thermodesulfobacteriota bacterium]
MSEEIIENCEFSFKCPLKWERLTETKDDKIRFCGECERNVYFCKDDEELAKHVERGDCVAVIQEKEMMLGGVDRQFLVTKLKNDLKIVE